MLSYPQIDPVIFTVGPLAVRWYGLMYVIGFAGAYLLVARQARQFHYLELLKQLDNLNLTLICGVLLGGRLGYVCFYNGSYYLQHPLEIFAVWQGGMSFHGGCIGALAAGLLYCRFTGLEFWKTADLYTATVPIGLFFGRLGNFINAELYGRVTDVPWAMVFPNGGPLPRHPSQLYEAFLEGLVMFILLWGCRKRPWRKAEEQHTLWPHGSILAFFLMLYGVFRFGVEFVREPDPQLGFVFLGLSMGQVLSGIMLFLGCAIWALRYSTGKNR